MLLSFVAIAYLSYFFATTLSHSVKWSVNAWEIVDEMRSPIDLCFYTAANFGRDKSNGEFSIMNVQYFFLIAVKLFAYKFSSSSSSLLITFAIFAESTSSKKNLQFHFLWHITSLTHVKLHSEVSFSFLKSHPVRNSFILLSP